MEYFVAFRLDVRKKTTGSKQAIQKGPPDVLGGARRVGHAGCMGDEWPGQYGLQLFSLLGDNEIAAAPFYPLPVAEDTGHDPVHDDYRPRSVCIGVDCANAQQYQADTSQ